MCIRDSWWTSSMSGERSEGNRNGLQRIQSKSSILNRIILKPKIAMRMRRGGGPITLAPKYFVLYIAHGLSTKRRIWSTILHKSSTIHDIDFDQEIIMRTNQGNGPKFELRSNITPPRYLFAFWMRLMMHNTQSTSYRIQNVARDAWFQP